MGNSNLYQYRYGLFRQQSHYIGWIVMFQLPVILIHLPGLSISATFDAATDDIRLDFRYKNHGPGNNAANKVWIRGDDDKGLDRGI